MENSRKFAIDIGGTLAKVAYLDQDEPASDLDFRTSYGTIHLAVFQSRDIDQTIGFLKNLGFNSKELPVTGGGAYKFSSELERELHTTVIKVDEIQSLNAGFSEVLKEVPEPAYTFSIERGKQSVVPRPLPSLLCNIGSGVSIIKLEEERISRVTGTCLGGGTCLGLATAILGIESYEELLELCQHGNANNTDLLMSDIYGSGYPDTLAVSLGKIAMKDTNEFQRADIAKSLLNMVGYNIGQIAYLATKLEKTDHVYFAGNFIRGYEYTMDRINYSVEYWSQGKTTALFLKHDGYFGALGALLKVLNQ
ncbi:PANK4 [Blepharisma stoltei]|uniref:Pantothenate kinase n=1 Tax=Blepharisma stoltei TaxID=1481888 RepID=A0AAU9JTN3_9CILI|nr:unnamed protein product [Blepharisma stoltei]